MSARCVHGFVSGRVQGVSFRAFTQRAARAAGITGYARNCADGRVEVLLCGATDAVDTVIAAIHRGPPLAQVTGVELVEQVAPAVSTGFEIG
jgi:acylphosphatase